ncbi:16S rRNA (uracil(1498)-N(3))-methyltransferase [Flavobacteriaceae bacterium]|nr:16S rRNA (uracil(1498)-N(3))-methyltransferase [Flavobacteriaceae bacterium]
MDLFYSNYKANDKYVVMNEIDSKHIIRSFRKNIGDSIMITNGLGYLCNAKIVEIGKKIKVKINSIEKFKSSSNSIHIALSPLKNASRFEWFVEKSTELGISQITPLVCEYSEKKKVNMDRLERILISSLKQSNQFFKPIINSIKTFEDFIRDNEDELLMANLKTSNKIKRELFTRNNICLMIGPEGGFSDSEIKLAKKKNIKEITLGNSRLRSETAAIFGLSVIKSLIS